MQVKFKISWPIGIIIAIVAFVVFILSFVYKATFVPAYDHHLVSDDYYKDELNYQQEIDNQNKAAELKENITLKKEASGLTIYFPSEFEPTQISGIIYFQRPSNNKIDFNLPIELTTNKYFLTNKYLIEGRWNVKIEWTVNNETYLFKEKIMY
ncbi:FixH family protein [Lutibacter sp.]|uniref:FixH family protein n=1 Tax=Lutibacter sp. TaxID=1925666 RepID=UPI0025B94B5E|nr:FixH family protein [Lutibacter sp.]MCF6167322.1 FixH family protein [Lutibacter sp.]